MREHLSYLHKREGNALSSIPPRSILCNMPEEPDLPLRLPLRQQQAFWENARRERYQVLSLHMNGAAMSKSAHENIYFIILLFILSFLTGYFEYLITYLPKNVNQNADAFLLIGHIIGIGFGPFLLSSIVFGIWRAISRESPLAFFASGIVIFVSSSLLLVGAAG